MLTEGEAKPRELIIAVRAFATAAKLKKDGNLRAKAISHFYE